MKKHDYEIKIAWTGNKGDGTTHYKSYSRDHSISGKGKYQEILGTSDAAFVGDPSRYNPEDLFLAAISACHMLWYLHLCSVNGVVVLDYVDNARGVMEENADESGKFTEATLYPKVTIGDARLVGRAMELHDEANKMCFIANSCNFKIGHQAEIIVSKKE